MSAERSDAYPQVPPPPIWYQNHWVPVTVLPALLQALDAWSNSTPHRVTVIDAALTAPYVTKTGRVLTDADIEALADEAERGYDVSHLIKRTEKDQETS